VGVGVEPKWLQTVPRLLISTTVPMTARVEDIKLK
jgi:hypothetical protein